MPALNDSPVRGLAFDCFFLADGMWERLVPAAWRPFLEAATDAQLAGLPVPPGHGRWSHSHAPRAHCIRDNFSIAKTNLGWYGND